MASTTVKLTPGGKERLDKLQARLTLLGRHYTKEQILDLIIEAASDAPGDLIGRAEGVRYPVSGWETLFRKVVDSAEDWGRISWRDIDRLVYGGKLKR